MRDLPESLEPFYHALNPAQQTAAALVVILNAAADPEFKSRYARRWWGMLEERVKLCAMTSSDLIRWSSCLSSRLGGTVGRNLDHRKDWQELIRGGEDEDVLDAMQYDTPAVIAFVRAFSDVRREEFAQFVAEERGEAVDEDQAALL